MHLQQHQLQYELSYLQLKETLYLVKVELMILDIVQLTAVDQTFLQQVNYIENDIYTTVLTS